MENDLDKLYKALISKGYSKEDIGSSETFRAKMSDKGNRRELYDYVSSRGDFRIGDYDTYEKRLSAGKPGSVAQQVIDEYDASMRNAGVQPRQTQQSVQTQPVQPQPMYDGSQFEPALQVPDWTTQHQKAIENIATNGKATPATDETGRPVYPVKPQEVSYDEAVQEFRENMPQPLNVQLRSLSEEVSELKKEVDREAGKYKGISGLAASRNKQIKQARTDEGVLNYAVKMLDEAQEIVDEAGKRGKTNFVSGLLRGVRDNAFDADNWTFGISDMIDNSYMLGVLQKADRGEQLTPAEEKLLDASVMNMAVNAYYGDMLGRGYKAGQVTAQSLPFMLEFAINPVSSSGSVIAKNLLKYGMKKFGGKAVNRVVPRIAARLAGDTAAAAAMTGTTGTARVAADAMDRLAGNYEYGRGEDGQMQVEKIGDMSAGEAAARGFGSTLLENQSEMIFNAFKAGGKLAREAAGRSVSMFGGLADKELVKAVKRLRNAPMARELRQRTQIGGVFEEYGEEVYNNLASVATGDMSAEDALSVDTNIDTFLGLVPTQLAFSAIGLGGLVRENASARKRLRDFTGRLSDDERELFDELHEAIRGGGTDIPRDFIKATLADDRLSDEQKKERVFAVKDMLTEKKSEDLQTEAEAQEQEEPAMSSEEIQAGKVDTYRRWVRAQRRVSSFGIPQESLDGMTLTQLADNYDLDDKQVQAVAEYKDAQQQFGQYEADFNARLEAERQRAEQQARADVDRLGNKDTGMVTQASYKFSEKPVYVTGGTLAFAEDGTLDRDNSSDTVYYLGEDGKTHMAPASEFDGIVSSTPAENVVTQQAYDAETIFKQAEQASLQSPDIPAPEKGVTFNLNGANYVIDRPTPDGGLLAYKLDESGKIDIANGNAIELSAEDYYNAKEAELRGTPSEIVDDLSENKPEYESLPEAGDGNVTAQTAEPTAQPSEAPAVQGDSNVVLSSGQQLADLVATLPKKKTGELDYRSMTPQQQYDYTRLTESPEVAAEDLKADVEDKRAEIEKMKQQLAKATGGQRAELRDKVRGADKELAELEDFFRSVAPAREQAETPDLQPADLSGDEEYMEWVAENSEDPSEAAAAYRSAKEVASHENNLRPWQQQLLGMKINTSSFNRFGDRNQVTGALAKGWLRKDGRQLDTLAQELSLLGEEVTEQDIVDFMLQNPSNHVSQRSEIMRKLAARFSEIASAEMGFTIGGPDSKTGRIYLSLKEANQKLADLNERQKQEIRQAIADDMLDNASQQDVMGTAITEDYAAAYDESIRQMSEEEADSSVIAQMEQQPIDDGLPTPEEMDEIYASLEYKSYGTERQGENSQQVPSEEVQGIYSTGETSNDNSDLSETDREDGEAYSGTEQPETGAEALTSEGNYVPLQRNQTEEDNERTEVESLSGESGGLDGENEAEAYLRRAGDRTAASDGRSRWTKESLLRDVVQRNKGNQTWIEDIQSITGKHLLRGGENDVYLSRDGNYAIKVNDFSYLPDNSTNFDSFMNRVDAHNELFPNDAITILGFTLNSDGNVSVVLSQPYISNAREATQEEIENFLEDMDFYTDMSGNWTDGIYEIADTKPNNVLVDEDGNLHFIDVLPYDTRKPGKMLEIPRNRDAFQAPAIERGENIFDYAERVAKAKETDDMRRSVNTNPTDAQKEAGNYKKGHVKFDGYNITIENPKGSTRSGRDAQGNEWSVTMQNDYGYIRGTKAVDGDHIDVFLSDTPEQGNVYVIDQIDQQTGEFDESKVMYGFNSMEEARDAYLSNYSTGWKVGPITEVSKDEFKKWIDSSTEKRKAFSEYKRVKAIEGENEGQTEEEIKPVGTGPFGNIYNQFKGKAKEAVKFLLGKKEGEAVGALHHKDIGDISLVWGNSKAGLEKIARKHPEVLGDLQGILDNMEIVSQSENRIKLESDTHFAVVSREFLGTPREQWLLTAYEKKETPKPTNSRMDVDSDPLGKSDDTATRQDLGVSSANKDSNSSETMQISEKEPAKAGQPHTLPGRLLKAYESGDEILITSMEKEMRDYINGSDNMRSVYVTFLRSKDLERQMEKGSPSNKTQHFISEACKDVLKKAGLPAKAMQSERARTEATGSMTDPRMLDIMSADPSFDVLQAVVRNPNTGTATLENIAKKTNYSYLADDARQILEERNSNQELANENQPNFSPNEPKETEHLRFRESLNEVNERFNEELSRYQEGKMGTNDMFHLGNPNGVMRMFLPDLPIVMRPRIMNKASNTKHNVDVSALEDLPARIAAPIFVFRRNDNALGILTEIKDRDGLNVCVAIELNKSVQNGGEFLVVNDIRSIHGRDSSNLIKPIVYNSTLAYVDKEKALEWFSSASSNYQQEITNQELSDATKIVENFENPTISSEKLREGGEESIRSWLADMLGMSSKARKRREAFAQREHKRMVNWAHKVVEKLHLDNVEIVTDVSTLEGRKARAKGFFNSKTGKITIVIPNHTNTFDVEQTLLHEAVAHYGLRRLFGKHFDTFLDNVYNNSSPEVKERIDALVEKYNGDVRTATEEYLASLAENTDFENAVRSGWFDKIKQFFLRMLAEAGIELPSLTDNELRYILWRSYENLAHPGHYRNVFETATDVAMQYELKVGNYAEPATVGSVAASESVQGLKAERIEKLRNSKPVEITGEEYKGKYELNRDSAKQWIKDNLRGEYTNKDTGEKIEIRKDGAQNVTSHSMGSEAHLKSLVAIPQMIENSVFIEDRPNEKDNYKYDRYRYYVCGLKIGDVDYTAKITVGVKGASKYYDHSLTKIEKGTLIDNIDALSTTFDNNQNALVSGIKDTKLLSILQENGEETAESEGNLLFREADEEPEYRKSFIRDRYERRMKSGLYQSAEAFMDSMQSLKETMDMTLEATGKKGSFEDVPGWMNAYFGENALSSVNEKEVKAMQRLLFKPLKDVIAFLARTKEEYEKLINYMFAKHGLERNIVMAQKCAERDFAEYQKSTPHGEKTLNDFLAEYRNRDYAGLTALTGTDNVADAEAMAERMVNDYEANHDTTKLWEKVNTANKAILSKTYDSGLISKETYEKVRDMYKYYIPLRGFDEKTGEETYAYLNHNKSSFNTPIKEAYGRNSKADDPIANMESMAESAVLQGNRNVLVKQRFLNFALNHPTDLVSVSELWLEYNARTDEWKVASPDINMDDTPKVVERKMREFEERMTQLAQTDPNRYKRARDAKDIPYRVLQKTDLLEHQVLVKLNGNDYILTVNGNPRLAQALNGKTNPDNESTGAVSTMISWAGDVNRTLSANYTQMSPDFVASNFARDSLYSNIMVWIKESPRYARKFNVNYGRLNPVVMKMLFAKYRNGKLDMNNERERLFKEFLDNGGETGYARMMDVDKHRKEIERFLKAANGKIPLSDVRAALGEWLGEIGRSIESQSRFAAYITSRQEGRDVARSVWDAKEISVNFNKKGAGDKFLGANGQTLLGNISALGSGLGRAGHIFWNAALQGTFGNFLKNARRHPVKALTAVASMFSLGFLVSALGAAGDDGDDDNYYNNPDYVRRTNLLIKGSGKTWLKIPLSIEFRAVYGMGELLGSAFFQGETVDTDEFIGQFTQLLPIDMMAGQVEGDFNWVKPLISISSVRPVVDVMTNVSWTGKPIYKDTPYNKLRPEWTKVYKSTNRYLVDLAAALSDATGGDKALPGVIDLNPAAAEYLMRGYFGGLFTLPNQLVKLFTNDFEWRNVPVANRFVASGDERTRYGAINDLYYSYGDIYDRVQTQIKVYSDEIARGSQEYLEKYRDLQYTDDFKIWEIFKSANKEVTKLNEAARALPEGEEEEYKELERMAYEVKKQAVEQVRAIMKDKKE